MLKNTFDLILPAIRPIQPYLEDDAVSEIMINGDERVFIERTGRIHEITADIDFTRFNLRFASTTIARLAKDDIDEKNPLLDARLPDGSRIAIAFPPISQGGPTLTIRKFRRRQFTLDELVELGSVPSDVASDLRDAVAHRRTILVSGGTGSGKTTMLNALANIINPAERVGLIEDTPELKISLPNVFAFQARREQQDFTEVSIRQLVKAALRHRPDRVIVGEVRGAEAWDLLQALNIGHPGSLSTIHAESSTQALSRLAGLTLQADIGIPYAAIQTEIGHVIDYVVQIDRHDGHRRVRELFRVSRFDPDCQQFLGEMVYRV